MAETTKLVPPPGTDAVSFGSKVWKAVKGVIAVEEEFVEHLLKHGGCSLPGAVGDAPAPTLQSKIDAAKLDFEKYIKSEEDKLAAKRGDFEKDVAAFREEVLKFNARKEAEQKPA